MAKNTNPEVEAQEGAAPEAVKGRPSKLTDEQVIDIRTRYHTVKKEDLAAEYGISTAYLYKVATGMAAKNVDFELVAKPEAPVEDVPEHDKAVGADNTPVED